MIIAYVYRRFFIALLLVISFKFVAGTIIYFLVTKVFHRRLNEILSEYDTFYLLKYMAMRRPMKTLFLIRFSLIPKFFKNYGIPLLGYSYWPFMLVSTLSDVYFTILPILFGMTARSFFEISDGDLLGHADDSIRYLTIMVTILSLSFFVYFIYISNKIMGEIQARQSIRQIKRKVDNKAESVGSVRDFLGEP
jgi:uncharacterized membrane protein YdjX (TVP38/TMEM64 family)